MKTLAEKWTIGIFAVVFLFGMSGAVLAEEAASPEPAPEPQKVHKKVEELKKLKQENPAEFERLVKERKRKMKARLRELKEKDPEKFEEMKERLRSHRRQYLKRLREENPQKFQEIMQKKMQKLRDLKQTSPEKYERFIRNHPKLARRLQAGPAGAGNANGIREKEEANAAHGAHAGRKNA